MAFDTTRRRGYAALEVVARAATDSAAVAPAFPTGGHMSEADQGAARVRELSHFIDGQRAAGASGQFADVYDPALGRVTARVPVASTAEVAAAVAIPVIAPVDVFNAKPRGKAPPVTDQV